jgi:hypothetical protein
MIVREPEVHMKFPADSRGMESVENKDIVMIVL